MTKLLTWSRRNRTGSVLSGDFLAASQNCFWDAYLDGWIHKWGCCIKFKASYSYKLIQERNLIIFVGNTVNTCLPIHWTDHEEAVPELLGDVGQISGFRADHAPVINQAVIGVNINKNIVLVLTIQLWRPGNANLTHRFWRLSISIRPECPLEVQTRASPSKGWWQVCGFNDPCMQLRLGCPSCPKQLTLPSTRSYWQGAV